MDFSRLAEFRLQASRRVLFLPSTVWTDSAQILFQTAGRLGFDLQIYLMEVPALGFNELPPFHNPILISCRDLQDFR